MNSVACEEMPSTGKRCPPVLPWTPAEAQDTSPPSPHHTHSLDLAPLSGPLSILTPYFMWQPAGMVWAHQQRRSNMLCIF